MQSYTNMFIERCDAKIFKEEHIPQRSKFFAFSINFSCNCGFDVFYQVEQLNIYGQRNNVKKSAQT